MWSILCIDHIRHLVCIECVIFWYPMGMAWLGHTHVLCMGSGSATGFFYQVRLVHSLVKYFFKFQLWYWIQIYTTKYSNLLLIILIISLNCLQHIQKRRNFDAKVTYVTSQFVYCYMPWHRLVLVLQPLLESYSTSTSSNSITRTWIGVGL